MALPRVFKIHPAIGVARIGTSPTAFFIGPEVSGRPPEGDSTTGSVVPPFKDANQIKRQGARFRIWQYEDNGRGKYRPVEEKTLSSKDVEWISWRVHLANKKAEFFQFKGLAGDPVFGPAGAAHPRRNGNPAKKSMWLDPGLRKISGPNKTVKLKQGTAPAGSREYWPRMPPTPPVTELGELRTDRLGRLIVLGGLGVISSMAGAAPISDYANNDGWYDDVSDGPVNALIKIKGIRAPITSVGAWCLCGPPSFAPFARNTVSLWDTLVDVAARELVLPHDDAVYDGAWGFLRALNTELGGKPWGYAKLSTFQPVFERDIWPVLKAGLDVPFLFEPAQHGHVTLGASGTLAAMYPHLASPSAADAGIRQSVFARLHKPGVAGDGLATGASMPKLLGDDPYSTSATSTRLRLTLTPTQYAMFEQWANGKFSATTTSPPPMPPATITPDGLDRAALEACVGGAFFPGIECGWQIRHPKLYVEPFRIDQTARTQYVGDTGTIDAGHFSRQMALPWAADFLQCYRETHGRVDWGWWPVPRPNDVYATQALATSTGAMVSWTRSTASGVTQNWASGHPFPSYAEMFANWSKLGFVIRNGNVLFETERSPSVP